MLFLRQQCQRCGLQRHAAFEAFHEHARQNRSAATNGKLCQASADDHPGYQKSTGNGTLVVHDKVDHAESIRYQNRQNDDVK